MTRPTTETDPTPRLLVVTGPPGSGRSTVCEALADRREPSVLVAAMRSGRTRYTAEA
jgi:broad-specificity NMP kinase